MFSIITMASSTTNPVEIVSAIKERLFRLKPTRYMIPKVPIRESGKATLAITVAQARRKKRKITRLTSATGGISVNCTSRTEARIVSVRSVRIETCTVGGIETVNLGSNILIRYTVSRQLS